MKNISEIHQALISKQKSVKDIVEESKKKIFNNEKKFNQDLVEEKNINAILGYYTDEFINSQIEKAQKMIDEGKANILTGVPIILKDNFLILGEKSSSGSKILENYTGVYTNSVVEKLKEKGMIFLARANQDEFAMGSSGENSAFGNTKNPIDLQRVPGGSSSGSAASVCYGACPVSLGSDTGGSIRLPAAFTNLVGFKPTYGLVSRYGLMAMSSSLDQIGPFTNNISDMENIFEAISFYDKLDATSIPEEKRIFDTNLKKKIAIPKFIFEEKFKNSIEKEIFENFEKQIQVFKSLDYQVDIIDIKNIEKALAIYYIICPAEVSSNMGRYDGVRYGLSIAGENTAQNFTNSRTEGFGKEVQRRILLGTYILSAGYFDAFYNKAISAKEILKKEFAKIFENYDAILTPTSPVFPWKFGEKNDPLQMYLADIFTVSANIVGSPAISIPTKKREEIKENNLPISIHLIGDILGDKKLLKIGKEFENEILK